MSPNISRLQFKKDRPAPKIFLQNFNLVGGWTNPFEKYARQIGIISPR